MARSTSRTHEVYSSEFPIPQRRPVPSPDELNRGPWPEIRIVRHVAHEAVESIAWNDYLNEVGRLNYGKGRALALGSMACTFVEAQEMGKMLSDKYPGAYSNRRKTIQLLRRFEKNFNQFVAKQELVENGLGGCTAVAFSDIDDVELSGSSILIDETGGIDEFVPQTLKWGVGVYAADRIDIFSRNGLGLDLAVNQQLQEQMEDVWSYLAHENLNTNYIDKRRRPHVVMFESYDVLGRAALNLPLERPRGIPLHPPLAGVNQW